MGTLIRFHRNSFTVHLMDSMFQLELALIVEEMQELRSLRIEKLKKQGMSIT